MTNKQLKNIVSYIALSILEAKCDPIPVILISAENIAFHCGINIEEVKANQEAICRCVNGRLGIEISYDTDCEEFEIYK